MGEQTEYDLMGEEGPMPFDDCPTHGGVECEYDTCPCQCDDCQDPEIPEMFKPEKE